MPGLADLLAPSGAVPPATPEEHGRLREGWRNFLSNPDTKAALIQFGINMLSPIPPGGNIASQIGQSLGAAGETVGERAEQRHATATELLNRKLDLTGLGLRQQQLSEQVRQSGVEEELARERIELGRGELDVARVNANTAARRAALAVRGGLTPATAGSIYKAANEAWADPLIDKSAYEDPETGELVEGAQDAFIEDYFDGYLEALQEAGVSTSPTIAGAPGEVPFPEVEPVAKPAAKPGPGEAAAASPPSGGTPTMTAEQFATSTETKPRFDALRAALTSPNAADRAKGLVVLRLVQKRLKDPEALQELLLGVGGRPTGPEVPVPPSAPATPPGPMWPPIIEH